MPILGAAFFWNVYKSHLWIVISNPKGDRGEFVIVNITTLDEKIVDESCVLQPADYPQFIKHPTAVFYDHARLWWMNGEDGFLNFSVNDKIIPMEKVNNRTLLRIQQGALKSDHCVPDYKRLVQDSLVVIPVA